MAASVGVKDAARALRAAEGLVRSATVLLASSPAQPQRPAGTATAAPKRRRRRGKRRVGKAGDKDEHKEQQQLQTQPGKALTTKDDMKVDEAADDGAPGAPGGAQPEDDGGGVPSAIVVCLGSADRGQVDPSVVCKLLEDAADHVSSGDSLRQAAADVRLAGVTSAPEIWELVKDAVAGALGVPS